MLAGAQLAGSLGIGRRLIAGAHAGGGPVRPRRTVALGGSATGGGPVFVGLLCIETLSFLVSFGVVVLYCIGLATGDWRSGCGWLVA
jgi:hypothetical protein